MRFRGFPYKVTVSTWEAALYEIPGILIQGDCIYMVGLLCEITKYSHTLTELGIYVCVMRFRSISHADWT